MAKSRARRTDALSKARIIDEAIAMLDAGGEDALTFRALAARLRTGSGAIYWHVADKNALLSAATDAVIGRVTAGLAGAEEPRQAIRTIALGLFDAIDAHSWTVAQLARAPWQSCVGEVFESIGVKLDALGVPEHAQFDAVSALMHYIFGAAGQNAANGRQAHAGTDRKAFLAAMVNQWTRADPGGYPFLCRIAPLFAVHDDREQFLAGVDLILAGIGTLDQDVRDAKRSGIASPGPTEAIPGKG